MTDWGYIPDVPRSPGDRKALLDSERAALQANRSVTHCTGCGFPAGRSLRCLLAGDKQRFLCPLCHAAADWSLAPSTTPVITLPEIPPPRLNQFLHEIYRWLASPDSGRVQSAKNMLANLQTRTDQMASMFGIQELPLTVDTVCQAFWRLTTEERKNAKPALSLLRLAPPPELFKNAYGYWIRHVYDDRPIKFQTAA